MIGKVKFIVDRFDDYARVRPMLWDDMPELEVIEKGFYLLESDDEKGWVIHKYLPLNLRYADVSGEGKETEYSGVIKKEGKKHGLIAAICFSVFAGVMVYEFRSPNYSLYFTSRSDPFGQEVERFRAKNDSLADVYGQARWEKVVELTKEQYRGDLSKDDSLDRVFPKTYYVQKIKGKIQPREIKVVPSNTDSLLSNMNRDRYRDAGWGMSIDEVSNIPYFRIWSRSFSPYHSSSRDSDYTVSFLNGVDTLAGVPFDYVLSFVEKPAMVLGGILLRSREYDDDSLLRRDLGSVCHQLRRKYGLPFDSAIYQHRWELTWKGIRCDTVAMGSGWAIRVMEIPELPDQGLFYSILRRHSSQRE